MNDISVLIADDHSVVRMGLVTLLEMESDIKIVGMATDGRSAVSEAVKTSPDVVVMDLMMPHMDGADATAAIKAKLPDAKVIIFTTFPTSDLISKALDNGATGAIFKSAADTELIKAIRKVAAGGTYISSDIRKLLASDPPIPPLSSRQAEILEAIARGLSNNEIAAQLGITQTVVREYTISLFQKIGAANRAEAAAIAMRKHLLKI